ncbi:MAG: CDF family Co(II)/Ni(II) efflux transporter DmeF [Rhodopseudomonas sp.]|uniref:CDF family Co(II)/Ni(II) efflux transporter DmeF n=1 Tax=Rhodopseudomonas sp. TaxID=1078 RepID=UPI0017DE9AB3|nr:CDF family Co(II)/Ni(II) efflux transporter DmeF [Rhodopseudomonas sp.]NVN86661.1 CDF family Co(II)/Ni(II) efflux transporter DmeF [Rhodopseudomonas sp.]
MHSDSLEAWTHDHVFLGRQHARNERRTWLVVWLTLAMMVAEIVGGTIFGSMALLADGWHMSTHAAAIGVAALAYRYARHHAHDPRFAFGTGKLGELAAFTSAVVLALIAVAIGYESLLRVANPQPIAYGEAIGVASVGLLVNLVCAWLLRDDHDHHGHGHGHGHGHDRDEHHEHHEPHHHAHDHGHAHHRDNNLQAAYVHVLADAATSVLAIGGLLLARAFGWVWIDPVVGLIGACVIASWAYGLMRDSGSVLIDVVPDDATARDIRQNLEIDGDRVSDLHLWQIGPGHQAAIVSIVTDQPRPPAFYKARLAGLQRLSHVTIEVDSCTKRHAEPAVSA